MSRLPCDGRGFRPRSFRAPHASPATEATRSGRLLRRKPTRPCRYGWPSGSVHEPTGTSRTCSQQHRRSASRCERCAGTTRPCSATPRRTDSTRRRVASACRSIRSEIGRHASTCSRSRSWRASCDDTPTSRRRGCSSLERWMAANAAAPKPRLAAPSTPLPGTWASSTRPKPSARHCTARTLNSATSSKNTRDGASPQLHPRVRRSKRRSKNAEQRPGYGPSRSHQRSG